MTTATATTGAPVARRPRLLVLSQMLPYPPDGGVKLRTFNVLRQLAREFDITALCYYRRTHHRDVAAARAALEQIGRVEAFPIPQEHSRTRFLLDHLRSAARGRAYTRYVYASRAFAARLAAVLAEGSFDLVHADSLDLSGYFGAVAPIPIACTHHDAQSVLLARRGAAERVGWRRAYLRHQSELYAREERTWLPQVALNVVVSPIDEAHLAQLAPGSRFAMVPNGVDVEYFRPERGADRGIVFVGGASWLPNADAMHFFAEEILPRLRRRGVDAPVTWVGRVGARQAAAFSARHGIQVTGYVDDVRPYIRDAACYVVPIRIGGGTRVKILDAWAMGKAIVSTSVGCEGLSAVDGANLLVRDDPDRFAQAVADVLADSALRAALGSAGRRTAEEVYDWERIGATLRAAYTGLLATRRG